MIDFEALRECEVQEFDTSSVQRKYLVCYKDRHFEVAPAVADLIGLLQSCDSEEEAAERFSYSRGKPYSEEDFAAIIGKCITPITDSIHRKRKKTFIVKLELFSAGQIAKLSKGLKLFFSPAIMALFLGAIVVLETLFFSSANTKISLGQLNLYTLIGVLLLYIASSGFHELGHAAACRHFGIKHGGVGFGLYLSFPVFYTDVSDVWKLPKKQRLVVNMAGTYFQLIFLLPLIAIYLYNFNPVLKYFIITVNLNFLITLNPFFKFDGYWMVSDLLGVPNLRLRTNELMAYLWKKITRKPIRQKPFLLTMKPGYKIFMAIYSVVMNLFFFYFFCYAIPFFFYRFFSTMPGLVKELAVMISSGVMPPFALIQPVFMQLLFFGFFAFMIVRMARPLYRRTTAKRRTTEAERGLK